MNARARRLADFQHGRAPELAALVETRAAASLADLEQRRAAKAEAERTREMLAEAIRVLADAAGMPSRPVCARCKRTMNSGCRACGNCGWRDPDAIRHWRAA